MNGISSNMKGDTAMLFSAETSDRGRNNDVHSFNWNHFPSDHLDVQILQTKKKHEIDTAYRAVCDLCFIRRADIKLTCGHILHARCIFQLPLIECPVCKVDLTSSDGLQMLPVEPHENSLVGDSSSRGQELRTGRWHHYETLYAQHIIEDFEAGTLPINEGTKLANLLCRLLNCNQTRLSKKLKIGKKFYTHCPSRLLSEEEKRMHQMRQRRISELEELFIMAEGQNTKGVSTAPLLSERMQAEWRERFVGHAHTMGQKLRDAWSWNSSRRNSAALSKLLTSMGPPVDYRIKKNNSSASPNDFNVPKYSPLFVVQHHEETNSLNQLNASSNNQTSVRSEFNEMSLPSLTTRYSAAHDDDQIYHARLFHQHLLMSNPPSTVDPYGTGPETSTLWFDDSSKSLDQDGKTDESPGQASNDFDISMLTKFEHNLISVGSKNTSALGEEFGRCLLERPSSDWKPALERPPTNHFSNNADETSSACSSNGMDVVTSPVPSNVEENSDNERFEDFIGAFLKKIPFEAVDVWVPLLSPEKGGRVVLFHAGYFTEVKELNEWGDYSNNFSFEVNEGLPGRVFNSNQSEWQENVHSLGSRVFLRLSGAVKNGIRTTFGIPVTSRKGITFVIVFYSRKHVTINQKLQSFIEETVRGWKFDATCEL